MNSRQNQLYQEIKEAHQMVSGTIQMVFLHEKSFKENVLSGKSCVGWDSDEYSIERCHAANIYRITLRHDNGREKDIYLKSTEVCAWSVSFIKGIK